MIKILTEERALLTIIDIKTIIRELYEQLYNN